MLCPQIAVGIGGEVRRLRQVPALRFGEALGGLGPRLALRSVWDSWPGHGLRSDPAGVHRSACGDRQRPSPGLRSRWRRPSAHCIPCHRPGRLRGTSPGRSGRRYGHQWQSFGLAGHSAVLLSARMRRFSALLTHHAGAASPPWPAIELPADWALPNEIQTPPNSRVAVAYRDDIPRPAVQTRQWP